MIERLRWSDRMLDKSGRLGRGICVEGSSFDVAAAWPETMADYLVRVGLPRDAVGAFALGCAASREARHGQVEAAPEKMNGAHFADKGGAELLKNCVYEHQNPPEPVDILRIVRGMLHVLIERNRVRNFHRHLPDLHLNTKLA